MDRAIAVTVYMAIALLFSVALWYKVRDWPRFVAALNDYRIVPAALAGPAAVIAAALEAIVVVATVLGQAELGMCIGALLLLAYASGMALNLSRGRGYIACGCGVGDRAESRLSWYLVIRNTVLAVLAADVAISPAGARQLGWIDAMTIAAGLVCGVSLYAALEAAMANVGKGLAAR